MSRILVLILILLIGIFYKGFSQNANIQANIGCGLYALHNLKTNQITNSSVNEIIGILVSKDIGNEYRILTGLNYVPNRIVNYQSELFELQLNKPFTLTSSFKLNEFQIPLIFNKEFNKVTVGAGITFTYLFNAVSSSQSSGDIKDKVAKYDFSNRVTTAPYIKSNLIPTLILAYKIHPKIQLHYAIGYTLLKNPQQYIFDSFRVLSNSISLTYNLKII